MERFSNKMAIAPTASISIICGGASPGIEPIAANVYNHKTLSGSFIVRNPLPAEAAGEARARRRGHLDLDHRQQGQRAAPRLPDRAREGDVFKTAFEIDQRWVIEHAADRTPYICQAQSVNLFLPANVHKRDLHQIHMHGLEARREDALLLPLAVDPARRHDQREGASGRRATIMAAPRGAATGPAVPTAGAKCADVDDGLRGVPGLPVTALGDRHVPPSHRRPCFGAVRRSQATARRRRSHADGSIPPRDELPGPLRPAHRQPGLQALPLSLGL